MAAYFTVNTTKLNGPRNYTTSRDVTIKGADRGVYVLNRDTDGPPRH